MTDLLLKCGLCSVTDEPMLVDSDDNRMICISCNNDAIFKKAYMEAVADLTDIVREGLELKKKGDLTDSLREYFGKAFVTMMRKVITPIERKNHAA